MIRVIRLILAMTLGLIILTGCSDKPDPDTTWTPFAEGVLAKYEPPIYSGGFGSHRNAVWTLDNKTIIEVSYAHESDLPQLGTYYIFYKNGYDIIKIKRKGQKP